MERGSRPALAGYASTLALLAGLGALPRLWQLDEQIVGGDEWHSVATAAQQSFGYIATHFHRADYCIPLTLHAKLLLETVGLSEWGLRAPELVAGIAAVAVLPVLVRRQVGDRASLLFAALLAISPLLVLYSRFARPYGLVAALGFVALASLVRWLESRATGYAVLYAGLTVATSWGSPIAAPGLLAPLGVHLLRRALGRGETSEPSGTQGALLLATVLLGIAAWLAPASASLASLGERIGGGAIGGATVLDFARLFAGASSPVALAFVVGSAGLGTRGLLRTPALARVVLAAILGQLLALAVATPLQVSVGLVLARYSILCLPLLLLVCAIGLADLSRMLERRGSRAVAGGVVAGAIAGLALAGPLPRILLRENSYAGHASFLADWDEAGKGVPPAILPGIPAFYRQLATLPGDEPVIEFPQVMWWSGTFQHRYQQLHGRRVLAGHPSDTLYVPGRLRHAGLSFANTVDVERPEEVAASGARFLLVHKDPAHEALLLSHLDAGGRAEDLVLPPPGSHTFDRRYGPATRRLATRIARDYRRRNVPVRYEDRWLIVFDLGSSPRPGGR